DLKLANELVERAGRLWPVRAETLPAISEWQADLADLRRREPAHARRRDELAHAGDDRTAVWEREQLAVLFTVLQRLATLAADVDGRRQRAETLRARSCEDPRWAAAVARIAANPHYGGLRVTPQLGLVPLGPDPVSGFEEFAHLESGEPAVRSGDGRLVLTEATGVVVVLVPGGHAVLGVENAPHADHTPANVDAAAPQGQQPCYAVDLAPYFLSRYEMTQAQWQRHTGSNPATFRPGGGLAVIRTTLHPVELVDWESCDRVLRELDLVLPSEAQWEFAYRAGTATIYPFGDDPHGLVGRENLADVTARDQGVNRRLRFVDWLDDGFLQHAPIGSFAPNAFGFHDMGGNVKEWCNDSWENYADAAPRADDGLRRGAYDEYRVLRGGSFSSFLDEATAAYRFGAQRVASGGELGLRPARALDR
ncbi:MAG: SUMF1/EgtB/PvdO family nonheme iron enzyme, partial [Planctomycetes bacterium]|nr:SUMF1/EgtB/PvdO family nonheme iron enzyme [Planctomycetota bacterium]